MDKLSCKTPVSLIFAVFVMFVMFAVFIVVFVLVLLKELMNLETGTSYVFLHTVLQTKTTEF